jgi:hypothetical protein
MRKTIPVLSVFFLGSCVTPAQLMEKNQENFSSIALESVDAITTVKGDDAIWVLTFSLFNCYRAGANFPRYV